MLNNSGRGSSIVKHDCGTAVAVFLSRTFGGPGILQSSLKRMLKQVIDVQMLDHIPSSLQP